MTGVFKFHTSVDTTNVDYIMTITVFKNYIAFGGGFNNDLTNTIISLWSITGAVVSSSVSLDAVCKNSFFTLWNNLGIDDSSVCNSLFFSPFQHTSGHILLVCGYKKRPSKINTSERYTPGKLYPLGAWDIDVTEKKSTLFQNKFEAPYEVADDTEVKVVSFSSNGDFLASGSSDFIITLWLVPPTKDSNWQFLNKLVGHSDWVRAISFPPVIMLSKPITAMVVGKKYRISDMGQLNVEQWKLYGDFAANEPTVGAAFQAKRSFAVSEFTDPNESLVCEVFGNVDENLNFKKTLQKGVTYRIERILDEKKKLEDYVWKLSWIIDPQNPDLKDRSMAVCATITMNLAKPKFPTGLCGEFNYFPEEHTITMVGESCNDFVKLGSTFTFISDDAPEVADLVEAPVEQCYYEMGCFSSPSTNLTALCIGHIYRIEKVGSIKWEEYGNFFGKEVKKDAYFKCTKKYSHTNGTIGDNRVAMPKITRIYSDDETDCTGNNDNIDTNTSLLMISGGVDKTIIKWHLQVGNTKMACESLCKHGTSQDTSNHTIRESAFKTSSVPPRSPWCKKWLQYKVKEKKFHGVFYLPNVESNAQLWFHTFKNRHIIVCKVNTNDQKLTCLNVCCGSSVAVESIDLIVPILNKSVKCLPAKVEKTLSHEPALETDLSTVFLMKNAKIFFPGGFLTEAVSSSLKTVAVICTKGILFLFPLSIAKFLSNRNTLAMWNNDSQNSYFLSALNNLPFADVADFIKVLCFTELREQNTVLVKLLTNTPAVIPAVFFYIESLMWAATHAASTSMQEQVNASDNVEFLLRQVGLFVENMDLPPSWHYSSYFIEAAESLLDAFSVPCMNKIETGTL